MSVRLLFFGATADLVGAREITLEAAGLSAASIRDRLISDHPKLGSQKLLLSVNQEYSSEDRSLIDGDEVAIFTAVSGG